MAAFTMKGLLHRTADLRDLTQYKYAKQTIAITLISMLPLG